MAGGDKNTRITIAKELSDKGQTHAVNAGGSALVVGGSLANGFATPAHITGGGNSSCLQRLVKGDFRCVFHAAVGKRLVFFHVKVGTDILMFCLL